MKQSEKVEEIGIGDIKFLSTGKAYLSFKNYVVHWLWRDQAYRCLSISDSNEPPREFKNAKDCREFLESLK